MLLNCVQTVSLHHVSFHSNSAVWFSLAKWQAHLKLLWCDDLADLCALYTLQFVFMNHTYHRVICVAFILYCILGGEGEVAFTVMTENRLLAKEL